MNYIKSTFNLAINLDATQISVNSKLSLWEKSECKVYITPIPFQDLLKYQEKYYALVQKALGVMTQFTEGKVLFKRVEHAYLSDVKVYWTKETRNASGMQFYESFYTNIKKPAVTIGIKGRDNSYFSEEEIFSIILHEFGHVLGLGHSSNPDDLMYRGWNPEVQFFSENDKFVFNLIYSIGNKKTFQECASYIRYTVRSHCYSGRYFKHNQIKELMDDLSIMANMKKYILGIG